MDSAASAILLSRGQIGQPPSDQGTAQGGGVTAHPLGLGVELLHHIGGEFQVDRAHRAPGRPLLDQLEGLGAVLHHRHSRELPTGYRGNP